MNATRHTVRRTALSIALAALALGAAAPGFAASASPEAGDTPAAATGLTREQVRQELAEARAAGTLSKEGEAGDTTEVLMARESFNKQQAETIMAQYRAEQERQIALREAEIALAAATADDMALQSQGVSLEEQGGSATRVDVMRVDGEPSALPVGDPSLADELVVVTVTGGDASQQEQRAEAIRRQLMAMGLGRDQIFIESADV